MTDPALIVAVANMTTKNKKKPTTSHQPDGMKGNRGRKTSALPNKVGLNKLGKARQHRKKKVSSSVSPSGASITTTNAVCGKSSNYKTLIEQANVFCERGAAYRKVGKYTQAIMQYQKALVIRESICGRYDTIEIEDIYFDLFDCHEREKQRRKNLELLGNSEEEEDHRVDKESIPYDITIKNKNRTELSHRKHNDDKEASDSGESIRTPSFNTDEIDDYYRTDRHMELERTNLHIERYRHMSTSWKMDTPYNGDYSMIDKILQRRNPNIHNKSKLETYVKNHGQCVAYEKMGDMQRSLGNFDLAFDAYHKAIAIEQSGEGGPSGPTLSYLCRKVACIISLVAGTNVSSNTNMPKIDWKMADKIGDKWMDYYRRHLSSDVCYAIQKGDEYYQEFDYHHAILEYQWGASSMMKSSSSRTISTYLSSKCSSSICSYTDDIPLTDLVIEEEEAPNAAPAEKTIEEVFDQSSGTSTIKLDDKTAHSQSPSHAPSCLSDIQIVLDLVQREFAKVHTRMDTLESRVERHSVKLKKRVDKKMSKVLDSIEKATTKPDQRKVSSSSKGGGHHRRHNHQGRYLEVGSDDDDDDVTDEAELVFGGLEEEEVVVPFHSSSQQEAATAATATCWTKVKQLVMHHLPSCCNLYKLECWTWFAPGNDESRRSATMVVVTAVDSHGTSCNSSSYSNSSIAYDAASAASCYAVEM